MATDPDPEDTPDDDDGDEVTVDRDELRTMIRDELRGVIDDLRSGGGGSAPAGDDPSGDTTGMSVRDVEAATERAVRKAMGDLAKRAPAKKPAPKKPPTPDPEPTPTDPPKTLLDKIRDKAWN